MSIRLRWLTALLATFTLLAGACGSDDGGGAAAPAATTAAPAGGAFKLGFAADFSDLGGFADIPAS